MSEAQADPGAQSALVWSNALTLLRSNSSLTNRQKGWLEGVLPEGIYGPTIVLAVENAETQQVLQNQLHAQLMQALTLANGGTALIPAFRILPPPETEPAPAPLTMPVRDEAVSIHQGDVLPQGLGHDDMTKEPTQVPKAARVAPASPTTVSHYDDAVVQTFDDILPGATFEATRTSTPTPVASAPTATPDTPKPAYAHGALGSSGGRSELDPETHLNRNDTFDNFVPGDSNRFARTVALAVAEGSGKDFNPLCIYGGSGLGKTHLLNAIGNYALLKQPGTRVRYVTSEEFTNEFIESLRPDKSGSRQIAAFNRKYREVDVLLIDDIQFLGGKTETLEQFFHTFNALYQANSRIVIASDVQPKDLKDFEDRLISRFEQGLTVDVQPPERETRIAILRMMASRSEARIPNDVFDLIAERFTENIRELEGALNRVVALASLNNQPVTRTLAEQTLQDFFSVEVEVKPTDIIGRVAKYFHLTFDDLVGSSRQKNITLARQIAMYLMRDLTSMSLVNIGQVFGGRDHTTVMNGCKKISESMKERQEIYTYVNELTLQLRGRTA